MVAPQFLEEKAVTIAEVAVILKSIEKRDTQLNYRSGKAKEYLETMGVALSKEKVETLRKKLLSLGLTRIKEEHIVKIIDVLPQTMDQLKVVFQGYPLTLSKTDQESIVTAIKESLS